eukprot:296146_1
MSSDNVSQEQTVDGTVWHFKFAGTFAGVYSIRSFFAGGLCFPACDWKQAGLSAPEPFNPSIPVIPDQVRESYASPTHNINAMKRRFNENFNRKYRISNDETKAQYLRDERRFNENFNRKYHISNDGRYSDERITRLNVKNLSKKFVEFKNQFKDRYPDIVPVPNACGQSINLTSNGFTWATKSPLWRENIMKVLATAPRNHGARYINPEDVVLVKRARSQSSTETKEVKLKIKSGTDTYKLLLNQQLVWEPLNYGNNCITFVKTNPSIKAAPRILGMWNLPGFIFDRQAGMTKKIPLYFSQMIKRIIVFNICISYVHNGYFVPPTITHDIVRFYLNPSHFHRNATVDEMNNDQIRAIIKSLLLTSDDMISTVSDTEVRDWLIDTVHNLAFIKMFDPVYPPNIKPQKLCDAVHILCPNDWIRFQEATQTIPTQLNDEKTHRITPIHTQGILAEIITGTDVFPTALFQFGTQRVVVTIYDPPLVMDFLSTQWRCPKCNVLLAQHTAKGCLPSIDYRKKAEAINSKRKNKQKVVDEACLKCSRFGHRVISCTYRPSCADCGGSHGTSINARCLAVKEIANLIIENTDRLNVSHSNGHSNNDERKSDHSNSDHSNNDGNDAQSNASHNSHSNNNGNAVRLNVSNNSNSNNGNDRFSSVNSDDEVMMDMTPFHAPTATLRSDSAHKDTVSVHSATSPSRANDHHAAVSATNRKLSHDVPPRKRSSRSRVSNKPQPKPASKSRSRSRGRLTLTDTAKVVFEIDDDEDEDMIPNSNNK